MEEALNALNIVAKVLVRRSNAMWRILLVTEETAKVFDTSVLTTKTTKNVPSRSVEWTEVVRRKAKAATPPPQLNIPKKGTTKQQQQQP